MEMRENFPFRRGYPGSKIDAVITGIHREAVQYNAIWIVLVIVDT
jgi:hypothetical protein